MERIGSPRAQEARGSPHVGRGCRTVLRAGTLDFAAMQSAIANSHRR